MVGGESGEATSLLPEWRDDVQLEDDEWRDRTLTKYVTALAQTLRQAEEDARNGVLRLF